MEATLKFTLPEEQVEFDRACNSTQITATLEDVRAAVRQKRKYGHDFIKPDEVLDWAWDLLHRAAEENGVKLD